MTTINEGEVKLSQFAGRTSKFQKYLDALPEVKPGKAVFVPVPDDPVNIHANLGHLLRRHAPAPPKGWRWTKRVGTRRGKRGVSIHLVKADAPGRPAKFAFGADLGPNAVVGKQAKKAKKKAKRRK